MITAIMDTIAMIQWWMYIIGGVIIVVFLRYLTGSWDRALAIITGMAVVASVSKIHRAGQDKARRDQEKVDDAFVQDYKKRKSRANNSSERDLDKRNSRWLRD